jgi:protein transport protein SEC20
MHDTLNTIMDTSKQLIIALEKSDWLDRLLILSGLGFFLLVVLFILKQRIVDRGLRIAFWWTRFLPDVKSGGGRSTGLEVGTVLTTATTTASAALTASSTALSLIANQHATRAEPSGMESDEPASSILENIPGVASSTPLASPGTYPIAETSSQNDERTDQSGHHDEL